LDIEINRDIGYAFVYHIFLNFKKPSISYTNQEIIDMTKTRFQRMGI
jgi:hypothetical protein